MPTNSLMQYSLNSIAGDVKIALDQNVSSAPLLESGDIDTLTFEQIIASKIVEAVAIVHSQAPIHLLDYGSNFAASITIEEDLSGWTLLPDDFMRFVVFKMSDWSRDVYKPIDFNDPLYDKQSARYKGLRGTPQRPICVLAVRPEGRVLEFYSCKSSSATVSQALYIPYPEVSVNTNVEYINIYKRCYKAVVYTIASLVCATLGDADKSKLFIELAKGVLV